MTITTVKVTTMYSVYKMQSWAAPKPWLVAYGHMQRDDYAEHHLKRRSKAMRFVRRLLRRTR